MLVTFVSQKDDLEFRKWKTQNPHGFLANEKEQGMLKRGNGELILHKAACPHLVVPEGQCSTSYAKVACTDRSELVWWVTQQGFAVVACTTCKPD
ncbi:MAG TPA: hypothetical protein VGN26_20620 [Armatimonadota bacterium]|jgi:hypothetical protein